MNTENFDTSKYIAVPIGGKNGYEKFTIIDKEDAYLFEGKSIFMSGRANDLRPCIYLRGKKVKIYNVIMGTPPKEGITVDHIDNNVLNNTRENLRFASKTQQNGNKRKTSKTCSSQFKGVYLHKQSNKWMAYIAIDKKLKHLGLFTTEQDAALAYNVAATAYFGEFAKLNKI